MATVPLNSQKTASNGALIANLKAHFARTAMMDQSPHPDTEWALWERDQTELFAQIEALPITPENAVLRGTAVWTMINGDLSHIDGAQLSDDTTVGLLLRQIVEALVRPNSNDHRLAFAVAEARFLSSEADLCG